MYVRLFLFCFLLFFSFCLFHIENIISKGKAEQPLFVQKKNYQKLLNLCLDTISNHFLVIDNYICERKVYHTFLDTCYSVPLSCDQTSRLFT